MRGSGEKRHIRNRRDAAEPTNDNRRDCERRDRRGRRDRKYRTNWRTIRNTHKFMLHFIISASGRYAPLNYLNSFPGHALHEKGLQRQTSVGTLVSSQERRAAVVPRINRGKTADKPVVNRSLCSSIALHRISFVRGWNGEAPPQVAMNPSKGYPGI